MYADIKQVSKRNIANKIDSKTSVDISNLYNEGNH